MTRPDSTPRPVPFSERGGIERTVFSSLKDAALANQFKRLPVRPKNPLLSVEAAQLDPLIPYEDDIRIGRDGKVWVSFIKGDPQMVGEKGYEGLVEYWNPYRSIDHAFRGVEIHVARAYGKGGQVHQRRLAVISLSNQLLDRYQSGPVSDDEMKALHEEAIEELFKAKYMTSEDPRRQKIAAQILGATQKDKRGYRNPGRARMMISQVRKDQVADLLLDERIHIKNAVRGAQIDLERDLEILAMQTFQKRAEIEGEAGVSTGRFEASRRQFLRDMHNLISPKYTVVANPLRPVAAEAFFRLYAKSPTDNQTRLVEYLGQEKAQEIQQGFVPFLDQEQSEQQRTLKELASKTKDAIETSNKRITMDSTQAIFELGEL